MAVTTKAAEQQAGLKLSYVHGASEQPLIGATIGQFFDDICARYPDRVRRWWCGIRRCG